MEMGFVEKGEIRDEQVTRTEEKVTSQEEEEGDEDERTEKGSGIRKYYIERRGEEKERKTGGHLEQEELLE
ncbi:hypothetical protein Csa_019171 [Cucumis sativus]|uniref:Uncharacterized protein n=1 Tax=Cucumis sativus TaxID=3659 RepID=A0A0A0KYK2_CUCSA|nr:hypothetical protein Csa_019171 [Cucumis sativus]